MSNVTNNPDPDVGNDPENGPTTNRRQLLQRIGLLAGVVYAAPVLLQLSDAHAGKGSGKGGRKKGRGKNGRGKRGSGKKGSGKKGRGARREAAKEAGRVAAGRAVDPLT